MYTKTNSIKFCVAPVISAEKLSLTMLNVGVLMETSVAAKIVSPVTCIQDTTVITNWFARGQFAIYH